MAKRTTTLSRQLLFLVVSCALLVSIPISLINFWIDYREESAQQRQQAAAAIALFETPLRDALWEFNDKTLRTTMGSLRSFPALHSAILSAPDVEVTYDKPGAHPEDAGPLLSHTIRSPNRDRVLGILTLCLDTAELKAAAMQHSLNFVLLVGIELVLLAVVIFASIKRTVTTPILALSRHVTERAAERLDQPAPVPGRGPTNELHVLAKGITRMQRALQEQLAERDSLAQTLRESQERLQHVADSIPVIVWSARTDGTIEYMSRRGLDYFGVSHDAIHSDGMVPMIHPDDLERHARQSAEFLATGRPYQEDLRLRRADGSYRWHSVMAVVQRDGSGQIVQVFGSSADITDRKASEEQLLQSQKLTAVGQLAGGVAHDFNNQLTAIIGAASLLTESLTDPEQRELAMEIHQAANRSAALTKNLLLFSRKGQQRQEAIDVHAVLEETIALLERSIDKRIQIRRELNATSATIFGDPAQLQSALLNLAINARDAMPHGGSVTFATDVVGPEEAGRRGVGPSGDGGSAQGSLLVVTVRDSGGGMSDEVKSRAFEPFFTTKPAGKGTGMGLASVYGTVRGHGGDIAIESELGVGTLVRIRLPLSDRTAAASGGASCRTKSWRRLRILIADDEASVRDVTCAILKAAGHDVIVAERGEEAVRIYEVRGSEIDVVVLDQIMPGISGVEAFRAIRQLDPKANVLLSSGYSPRGEVQAGLNEGARGFLPKPFEPHQLLCAVAAAADNDDLEARNRGGTQGQ